MSLWSTYLRSSPRTKALLGAGVIAWGAIGMLASDGAETALGLTPTAEDEKRLHEEVDRFVPRISAVDKVDKRK